VTATASDDGLVPLCRAVDVADGRSCRVVVGSHAVAVFNVGGRFHVTDDTCTHGFASLADGELDGCIVTCAWHGGAFDVATGRAVGEPCTVPLSVYRCTVRDGEVHADLFEPVVIDPAS
jgi:nitrite reductase/ring-hydroxylating ferredoxin subunit